MLFNSIEFLLFFSIVIPLYFALPYRLRVIMLLLASCYFYMFFVPIYIVILFSTIVIDYFAGILIERSDGKKRKAWLLLSLIANIGILCYFKYFNFLNENLTLLLHSIHVENKIPNLTILLPIGLSFHTFQAMSYTIEVYRGKQKSERNFITYALYVMFFPQLVAGPIERPQNLLHQFKEKHRFDYARTSSGLKLMAWGLFKKVVVADRLSGMVDFVYNNPTWFNGVPIILGMIFFSIQIYCDFSGYSDIAIGSARIMGIDLMKNFDRPYASKSIPEFWRRWHISLSTWFKDYLYIPLGGNRGKKWRVYLNLMIVFLISGLWHGASWNFIIWGAIHGSLLIIYMLIAGFYKSEVPIVLTRIQRFITTTIAIVIVFCLTSIAWVFFRARTFDDAKYLLKHMTNDVSGQLHRMRGFSSGEWVSHVYLGGDKSNFIIAIVSIVFLFLVEYLQSKYKLTKMITKSNPAVRFTAYGALLLLILYYGVFDKNIQFIYFQF
jgi:D-alanyl-lipoteichoic acid acyltransferase DltB (MBOAT superfamily)